MTSLASIEHEITNILAVPDELEDIQPQALEYLVRLLSHYGVKSLKGNYGSLSLRDIQSVDVTDVNELPMAYKDVIVEQKPKKKLIKEALELGFEIDGVQLVPKTIITIR